MKEIWKTVEDYPKYKVSNFGNVIGPGSNNQAPKILKPDIARVGLRYHRVTLKNEKGTRKKLVHRLVLETFTGKVITWYEASHLDGNPENNNLNNLKWSSRSENNSLKRLHGTQLYGEMTWNAKLTNEDVIAIRKEYIPPRESNSKVLAKIYNIAPNHIVAIATRRSWGHVK